MKEYYKILGVNKKSNKQEIKRAYHQLALTYHPDKGGNVDVFKNISEAYEVLSNDTRRDKYDNNFSDNTYYFKNPFDVFDEIISNSDRIFMKSQVNISKLYNDEGFVDDINNSFIRREDEGFNTLNIPNNSQNYSRMITTLNNNGRKYTKKIIKDGFKTEEEYNGDDNSIEYI
jgi:DnaJ-class molecular chaperone